jgi:hypothetical protein
MATTEKQKIPAWNPEFIRDLSEKVYRRSLGDDDVRRMIEKDEDGGKKLRSRASSYDKLSRTYLELLGFTPPSE